MNDGPTTPRGDDEQDGLPLPIIISILAASIIFLVVSAILLNG